MIRKPLFVSIALTLVGALNAADSKWADLGNDELERYFARHVAALEKPLDHIRSPEDWAAREGTYRARLFEMLGLDPLPERTDLKATITGTIEREDFKVEKLHFQSRPGLYVTANFYLPKDTSKPVPAVLYVCGHGRVKIDGVSYGNKAAYQHHGAWFARNGYACLTIDTLQLGEIEGIHHGTYSHDRWWWIARGYTPAGVEAWNCIRALDYLQSRPEVDAAKLGVTGRSGGGAYSWWISSLDERIQAAVPVAGITSLRNHVVDGCIEGHCDCMYQLNTYRWDYSQVAALVSPRPLLISNTDKDRIFPLDGVVDVYNQTRRIYEIQDKLGNIGLNIEEGPHKDTLPLRTSAFHWLNRHLKGADLDDTFEMAATKLFEPQELKVFDELPEDEKNTSIDETFVPKAEAPVVPKNSGKWESQREGWMTALREKCFRGWPEMDTPYSIRQVFEGTKEKLNLTAYEIATERDATCHAYVVRSKGTPLSELDLIVLNVLDDTEWTNFLTHIPTLFPEAFPDTEWPEKNEEQLAAELQMHENFRWGMVYFCPRGIGPHAWTREDRKLTQIRRRFALIGQTVDGMRTWDTRQAIRALRGLQNAETVPLWLQASGPMAGNALYASLFLEQPVARLDLHDLPVSHRDGPIYPNVLRFLDMPQAVALGAGRSRVRLYVEDESEWAFPVKTAKSLGWDSGQIELRNAP